MNWFRCTECRTIISRKDIKTGSGCRQCNSKRMNLTMLTFVEKIIEILRWPSLLLNPKHWKDEEFKVYSGEKEGIEK